MIKHIVMWKFKPGTEKSVDDFLDGLSALNGQIQSLKSMEIGKGVGASDFDAVLITTFDDESGLNAYKNDPRHLAVSALCKSIREARHSVDFYIDD